MVKICKKCNLKIQEDEKHVTWITFDNGIDIETINWHWECFLEWRNKSLEARAIQLYNETISKVMPQASNLLNSIIQNARTKNESNL